MDLMTWLRAEWDRVLGFTLIAAGAVLLVLGYIGVSDSPYVAEQLAYIVSGGLGGMFLLGAGATLLILADLHDEWRKLDRVEAMLSGEIPLPARLTTGANGVTATPAPVPAPVTATPVMANGTAAPSPALMVVTTLADPARRPPEVQGPEVQGPEVQGPTAAAVLRRERFTLGIGLLLAVAVLFGSWARAANVEEARSAIAAVGVAIFGLVLVALGAVGSTLTVKRHVQLRKARVFAPFLDPEESVLAGPVAAGTLVVAPGLTRYHRAECPSVDGLTVEAVDRRAVPAELDPCHLCDPE